MQINRRQFGASVLATVSGVVAAPAVFAQQKFEMKLAYFVGDQHAMSRWLIKWSDNLEKESGGRITVKRFPGAQMGPVQQHYDFARTGQADVSWFLHGATPGRFPLTELVQLPYLVGSAEIGTKMLNDPELRAKYLDAEHRGVKVLLLLTHQPGNVHTTKKPIRTADDMKGLRLRFASPTIRDFVAALGGTPVGVVPTEQVEQLQKGTIDGIFIDYGGAGIAFKMGGTPEVFDRDVFVRVELRRRHERGLLEQAAARPQGAGDEVDDRRREGGGRGLGRARHPRQEGDHGRRRRRRSGCRRRRTPSSARSAPRSPRRR